MFPKFLLKKLYLKDSLKLEGDGFSFIIRNTLATGTIIEVYQLKIDGEANIAFQNVDIIINGELRNSNSISSEQPIIMMKGTDTKFFVHTPLSTGEHTIELHFKTKEIGIMKFNFTDQVK